MAARLHAGDRNRGCPHLSDHKYKGRREDARLVTGRGRYTADHDMAGQVCAHFLRADRAHARIVGIDTAEARKLPGVLDVVTGEDMVAAGWKSPPPLAFFKGVGGSSLRDPFRPALAHGRVRLSASWWRWSSLRPRMSRRTPPS
jgi:carbon-monoxide dehydrogenase large subunit